VESITVRTARYDPETGRSGWSDFRVPVHDKTTVLDCLDHVQKTADSTLAFRYACRAGICGSCAMVVNSKERWTCRTRIRTLGTDVVTIQPLRHMPVIRDLVVDFTTVWKKYRQVRPAYVPKPGLEIGVGLQERARIDPNIQCIGCGACYSSCSFVGSDPFYLGPHAMNRVFTLVEDSRDALQTMRLDIVDNEHGCWKCHTQMNCTEVCPMDISPSAGIQVLKRAVVARRAFSPPRRKFLISALTAAAAAVVAIIRWEPSKRWVTVDSVANIPDDGVLEFVHEDTGVFLRKRDGEIDALSRSCSHQGCPVMWNAVDGRFDCLCHDGMFSSDGQPISGPPRRSLERIQTRVRNGTVEVLI
jgi:succinate dehydrogenase/fumarate reductase iron-sulfur protein